MAELRLRALRGIGEIRPGERLGEVLTDALRHNDVVLRDHDVVAVCQKVVSKSENRYRELADETPTPKAVELAAICGKDARYVEVVLQQATDVVRCSRGVLIVRHKLGFVVANAGVDQSNIERGDERVLLLPEDPDASAERLRVDIEARHGVSVGVVVTDSFGRAWRKGVIGVALGCAGLQSLRDRRGERDRQGRELRITEVALGDQIASAATLVMGEADEGLPMVVISGLAAEAFNGHEPATALIRPAREDLFL